MSFNFNKYKANNPLLQEIDEEVTVSSSGVEMEEEYESGVSDIEAYGSGDTEELEGMGSQMDEEVNYDKVNAVTNETLEAMRKSIKSHGLSTDDVHELRIKLAEFFK